MHLSRLAWVVALNALVAAQSASPIMTMGAPPERLKPGKGKVIGVHTGEPQGVIGEWEPWGQLGGTLSSAPSATGYRTGPVHVFALDALGRLGYRSWDDEGWHAWNDLGKISVSQAFTGMIITPLLVPIPKTVRKTVTLDSASSPACVSKAPRHIDCFLRGPHGDLWHRWTRGDGWERWERFEASLTSAPSVTSWGERRLDVFARGAHGQLIHLIWNGERWSKWVDLDDIEIVARVGGEAVTELSMGTPLASAPACVAPETNRIHCFVRGELSRELHHISSDGRKWSNWQELDGEVTSSPSATSWGGERIDVFARGTSNQLLHRHWTGRRWTAWEDLGGELQSAPACIAPSPHIILCFAKGADAASGLDGGLVFRGFAGHLE